MSTLSKVRSVVTLHITLPISTHEPPRWRGGGVHRKGKFFIFNKAQPCILHCWGIVEAQV